MRYTDPLDIRRHTKGRKIAAMWDYFGMLEGCYCGNCIHLKSSLYRDHWYHKCRIYGVSNSEATDWVKGWTACKAYNVQTINRRDIYKTLNVRVRTEAPVQLDGQISMEELTGLSVRNSYNSGE